MCRRNATARSAESPSARADSQASRLLSLPPSLLAEIASHVGPSPAVSLVCSVLLRPAQRVLLANLRLFDARRAGAVAELIEREPELGRAVVSILIDHARSPSEPVTAEQASRILAHVTRVDVCRFAVRSADFLGELSLRAVAGLARSDVRELTVMICREKRTDRYGVDLTSGGPEALALMRAVGVELIALELEDIGGLPPLGGHGLPLLICVIKLSLRGLPLVDELQLVRSAPHLISLMTDGGDAVLLGVPVKVAEQMRTLVMAMPSSLTEDDYEAFVAPDALSRFGQVTNLGLPVNASLDYLDVVPDTVLRLLIPPLGPVAEVAERLHSATWCPKLQQVCSLPADLSRLPEDIGAEVREAQEDVTECLAEMCHSRGVSLLMGPTVGCACRCTVPADVCSLE